MIPLILAGWMFRSSWGLLVQGPVGTEAIDKVSWLLAVLLLLTLGAVSACWSRGTVSLLIVYAVCGVLGLLARKLAQQ